MRHPLLPTSSLCRGSPWFCSRSGEDSRPINQADKYGRKSLLLVGFAARPIRALLFALIDNPPALLAIQLLDGITVAIIGAMTPLVIADVTQGTGRFNLAQGVFGTAMGVGATLNPTLSGLIVHHIGYSTGFISLACEGLAALVIVTVLLPETRQNHTS